MDPTLDKCDILDTLDMVESTSLSSEDGSEVALLEHVAPMSSNQSRMWFPYQLLTDKTTYNCTTSYRLRGPLDIDRYEAALDAVIRKNQTLRTGFYTDPFSGDAMQAVTTSSPFQLKTVTATNDTTDVSNETALIANHCYDLENHDVFVATLLAHDPEYHTIIFGYHHIIMDGVSWQLFLQEVERFYSTRPRSPRHANDYIYFAVKQQAELGTADLQTKRDFWKKEFADLPPTIPLFPFAKVRGRKPLARYDATEAFLELDQSLVARIKAVAVDNKSTTFHFYLTTLQILARRMLKIQDVCIGITDANRSNPAFLETMGLMLDSLPLRFRSERAEDEPSFGECLQDTRATVYSALGNSGVALDVISDDVGVETSTSHLPLFQILVNYRMGAIKQKSLGKDVELDYVAYHDARHPFDFILTIDEEDGRAGLTLSMQDYLYDKTSAGTFMETFVHLLETFSERPGASISDCRVYPPALVKRAIRLGEGQPTSMDWPSTLTARVDHMVSQYPSDPAIQDGGTSYTYQEMAGRVADVSEALLAEGITRGSRVGVFGGPSADIVLSLLAILRIGAVYVPLDERNSDARLSHMVSDAAVSLAIVSDETEKRAPALTGQGDGASIKMLKVSDIPRTEVLPSETTTNCAVPGETGFIMFTSGSTGKPKGVVISNGSLLDHVKAATVTMGLGREAVLQQSALSYDASLAQIFYALANGGRLVITSNREDPSVVAALMVRERVSLSLMAPSEYAMLLQYGRGSLAACSSWRVAMSGGEAFPPTLRSSFGALSLVHLQVWNAYGMSCRILYLSPNSNDQLPGLD